MSTVINDEIRYKLLKLLEENPNMSQRELSRALGFSLGKVNYCVKVLVEIGYVKLVNFTRSVNESGYAYVLTPRDLKEKAKVTLRFLEKKQKQYDQLKNEIAQLQQEIQ